MFIRVRLLLVDFCDSLRQTRCMKAVQVNDGVVSVENVSEPRGEGVIVDVRTVGICGSDLHLIDAGTVSYTHLRAHET